MTFKSASGDDAFSPYAESAEEWGTMAGQFVPRVTPSSGSPSLGETWVATYAGTSELPVPATASSRSAKSLRPNQISRAFPDADLRSYLSKNPRVVPVFARLRCPSSSYHNSKLTRRKRRTGRIGNGSYSRSRFPACLLRIA
jgi:hypothetical protein